MSYALKHDDSQWGTGRRSKVGAKLALLFSGDDGMVQTALISPIMASLVLAFPDASELMIDQAMSITALTMIPAMLFTSFLAKYFDKKHLIMIGTVIFMLAGLSAMFAPTIEIFVLTRAVLGLGAGTAFPLVPSSIAYLFKEHEKNQMLGWMNACGAFLSFTLSLAAGWVAMLDWRSVFLFYLIFVPILLLQWLFLPNFKPELKEAKEAQIVREPVNGKMRFVCLCMLCFMILSMVLTFKLSIFLELGGIGTPADSGLGISTMTCFSFLISLVFVHFLEKLKRFTPSVSLCFSGLAFLLIALAQDLTLIYIGMAFQGLAMGTMNPFFMSIMSKVAPDSRKTLGMTMMCIFQLGGQIITPYYMIGVAALGFATERALFGFTAAIFFIVAIVVAVFAAVLVGRERRSKGA